jgi:phosphoenolpyruvate-protein phosphotransferase
VGRILRVVSNPLGRDEVVSAPAADHVEEAARLKAALDMAAAQLDALAHATAERAGSEVGAIFEAQALFARDPGLVGPALEAVAAGESAAAAFDRVAAAQADQLATVDDEYFRERAADVRDVSRRVVGILTEREAPELLRSDGVLAVLVADDLDPSTVAALRPGLVAGIALAGGAPNGHSAIVARALGMPLVLGLGAALDGILDDEPALVDGSAGYLVLNPDASEVRAAVAGGVAAERAPIDPAQDAGLPVVIEANVGSAREADLARDAGAAGIGLVRTELLFLGRSTAPGVQEQRALYRRIVEAMGGRPVVFRTLDIGGDKPAAYQVGPPESNPALGVRGIRLGLREPALFRSQIEALIGAAAGSELRILLPMIAGLEELEAARSLIDEELHVARASGRPVPERILVGIMIEIPAAAVMADAFAPEVDFFSIGTNDLVQYTLAADRTNPALADLASPYQPAVLRLIHGVTTAAAAAGRPVAVCGEAAADPLLAPILVGLGVNELSVAPGAIARLRATLHGLDVAAARASAGAALASPTAAGVREIAERLRRSGTQPDEENAPAPRTSEPLVSRSASSWTVRLAPAEHGRPGGKGPASSGSGH